MYEWLLFAHVLAAFALVANVVMLSAFVSGVQATPGAMTLTSALGATGGLGTLVFGVWLALDSESFGVFDGWVLAALALWVLTMPLQEAVVRGLGAGPNATAEAIDPRRAAVANWLRAAVVLALLVVMIYKPGA